MAKNDDLIASLAWRISMEIERLDQQEQAKEIEEDSIGRIKRYVWGLFVVAIVLALLPFWLPLSLNEAQGRDPRPLMLVFPMLLTALGWAYKTRVERAQHSIDAMNDASKELRKLTGELIGKIGYEATFRK